MNGIQGTKPYGIQWYRLLGVVNTIVKYNKIIIDDEIFINFFSGQNYSYLTVCTDDVLNAIKNDTAITEPKKVSE